METITIQVDPEVAQAYRESAPQKQQKIQTILNDWLKLIVEKKSLDKIVEEMQKEARMNGLTQEILDKIIQNQ